MMNSHGSLDSVWSQMHSPIHLFGMTLMLIGLIAITLWLWSIRADQKKLLRVAIIALALSVVSGFVITGSNGKKDAWNNSDNHMPQMMCEHPEMMQMMEEMMQGHASNSNKHDNGDTAGISAMDQ